MVMNREKAEGPVDPPVPPAPPAHADLSVAVRAPKKCKSGPNSFVVRFRKVGPTKGRPDDRIDDRSSGSEERQVDIRPMRGASVGRGCCDPAVDRSALRQALWHGGRAFSGDVATERKIIGH
jgi:hypothetical protein